MPHDHSEHGVPTRPESPKPHERPYGYCPPVESSHYGDAYGQSSHQHRQESAHRHPVYFQELISDYQRTALYRAQRLYREEAYSGGDRQDSCHGEMTPDSKPTASPCPPVIEGCLYLRKSAFMMTAEEQSRFRSAWTAIALSGFLGDLVTIHSGPHRMHGDPRFLPWHRLFLARLEQELHRADPCAILPYWNWEDNANIPSWLVGFAPPVQISGSPSPHLVQRNGSGAGADLPSDTAFALSRSTYTDFAQALEGIHNGVHVAVGGGGDMSLVQWAPADPLFWLHHANCDRLWHKWQQVNPGLNPSLPGADIVMDPWSDTEGSVRDITAMGFIYV